MTISNTAVNKITQLKKAGSNGYKVRLSKK